MLLPKSAAQQLLLPVATTKASVHLGTILESSAEAGVELRCRGDI